MDDVAVRGSHGIRHPDPFPYVPPLDGESPKGRNHLCFYLMFLSFPRYEVMAGPTRAMGLAGETSETFQTPCHIMTFRKLSSLTLVCAVPLFNIWHCK